MSTDGSVFEPLPTNEALHITWPTPNHHLFDNPACFFASTKGNPDYGKPGWTRECGRRLHRGCDIAPIEKKDTGKFTMVEFTDCETNRDYQSYEPTFEPYDPIFCLADGIVDEAIKDGLVSDFGIHVVIRHRWPKSDHDFYTLYGHLASLNLGVGDFVEAGQQLGVMGTTSRIKDARNWMAIAPHLHLEIWNANKRPYNPEAFLRKYLRRDEPRSK